MVGGLLELREAHAESGWDRSQIESVMVTELQAIVGPTLPANRSDPAHRQRMTGAHSDQNTLVLQREVPSRSSVGEGILSARTCSPEELIDP